MAPVHVPARRVAIWTATIVLVLLAFVFFWLVRDVVFLLFLSILLATGIDPLVQKLRRGPFNRSTGILVIYTFIFGVLALLIYLTVPPVIDEGRSLIQNFSDPQNVRNAIDKIDNSFFKSIASTAYDSAGSILQSLALNSETVSIGLGVVQLVFSGLSVFVIAFYWLTERPTIKRFVFSFVSTHHRERGRLIWEGVEGKLGAWVRGQLVLMVFIGVVVGVGYTIMGLKFAFALAVFAALAELIPLVGPYIGGAPAVLIALTQSVSLALIVIVFIVIVQLVEGNFLVPRIMESAVGVTPLTVILGILVGSALDGIGGALIAVPVAAAVQVTINNVLSFGSEATPLPQAQAGATDTGKALEVAATVQESKHQKQGQQAR